MLKICQWFSKKILLAAFVLAFSGNAYPSGWLTNDGSGEITSIDVQDNKVRVTFTADSIQDPDQCGNQGIVVLDDSTKNGDRIYSALLMALATKNPVRIYADGCFSGWGTTYQKLFALVVDQ